MHHILFFSSTVALGGDMERNSGPNFDSEESFSVCHWNLNSLQYPKTIEKLNH